MSEETKASMSPEKIKQHEPIVVKRDPADQNIVRLNRGELAMVHPAFRHSIKIVFPKAPFYG